jgi:hypothetical protein
MAATKYTYLVSTDFTGLTESAPSLSRLTSEIQESAIVTALDYINMSAGETVDIWFKDALSGGDQTVLDGLVAAHTGEPMPNPTTTDGVPIFSIENARFESDGKQVMVPSPATHGWNTWFTGAGDDTASAPGRGEGSAIRLSFTGADDKYVDIQFTEPVEMHDGEIFYSPVANWDMDDIFTMSAYLGATSPTSTPGTGNCDKQDSGQGFDFMVPAAGDGDWTLDFTNVWTYAPVPQSMGGYYWSYDKDTGAITAASAGDGNCNLLSVPVEVKFLTNIPMGHTLGRFEIDTYKVEYIHPGWKLRLRVVKSTTTAGEAAAWIMVFRRYNT